MVGATGSGKSVPRVDGVTSDDDQPLGQGGDRPGRHHLHRLDRPCPNDPAGRGYQTELPDGTRVPGFDLDPATRANFLKFMAASDLGSNGNTPDSTIYGHFREAALERGSYYLQQAIHNNHGKIDPNDPAYQAAMRQAIGLTSATDGAAAGVLIDGAKEGSSNDQTALHAQQLAYEKAISDYNVKKGYVDDVNLAMSAAGLIPGAGTATGAGSLIFARSPTRPCSSRRHPTPSPTSRTSRATSATWPTHRRPSPEPRHTGGATWSRC